MPTPSRCRVRSKFLPICMLLACVAQPAVARDFELPFWPTPGAERDPRVLRTEEGACGNLVIAKVRSMPNPIKGDVLGTDQVYELSSTSKVLRQWYLPANALPIATAGDELVFSQGRETYAVGTAGSLRALTLSQPLPASSEVNCKMPKALSSSGYARCHVFPQISGNKKSTLAFQGPCT